MKSRWISIFWSLVMIAAGVLFLLQAQGIISLYFIPTRIIALVFAVLSAFFLLTYFLQGTQSWGWLFPASILGGVALTVGLEGTPLGDILTGAPVLLGIAIPFAVIFLLDKSKRWALIPAWAMAAISLVILFAERVDGNLVGAFVLYSIALPFLAVYLIDRSRRWALIPFAALAVIGLIPLLESVLGGEKLGLVIMFLFAIPFFAVYFWSKPNWWALIPAGVFTTIGLVVLLSYLPVPMFHGSGFNSAGTGLILFGFGITFGALWLRRATQPTDWAKFPAAGLIAAAALSLALGQQTQVIWPILLIMVGMAILGAQFIRSH